MFKKTSLALMVSVSFGASAGSVILDGHFGDDDNYDQVFAINYYNSEAPGTAPITGGVLALSTHGDKQYVYISHPLGFKDLSYGEDIKYTVGWGGGKGKGKDKESKSGQKDLDNAIKSEFIALQLTRGGGEVYGVTFNPNPPAKGVNQIGEYTQTDSGDDIKNAGSNKIGDGTYTTTDGLVNISYFSTSDYNEMQATDYNDNTASWFEDHSPETVDCGNESSSDAACYNIAEGISYYPDNYIEKTEGNFSLIKWDFNWGLEIELDVVGVGSSELFFGDLANINLESFGYQSDTHIISLDALHASKPKVPIECEDGEIKHEPCDAEVVPHTDVPEPSTFAIFSLALAGLWARKRRSLNK